MSFFTETRAVRAAVGLVPFATVVLPCPGGSRGFPGWCSGRRGMCFPCDEGRSRRQFYRDQVCHEVFPGGVVVDQVGHEVGGFPGGVAVPRWVTMLVDFCAGSFVNLPAGGDVTTWDVAWV